MSWYKFANPLPSSYLSIGHKTLSPTIIWGHDGKNLHQKQVTNDVVEGRIEDTGHNAVFPRSLQSTFIATGRIDLDKNIGSFATNECNELNYRNNKKIQKATKDILSDFPHIRFAYFDCGKNMGTLNMNYASAQWYNRYKIATEGVPEEDLGMLRDFAGIEVHIENPAGTERVGVNDKGTEWRTKMKYDYGFVYNIKGTDGDALDVYLGPDQDAKSVYVVHQVVPDTGEYDEDKCMLGFSSPGKAKEIYLDHYDSEDYFGSITEIPFSEFKKIVNNGDRNKVNWKKKGKKIR